MKKVYVVGTCDTKLRELTYAREMVERAGAQAVLVDISTGGSPPAGDVAPVMSPRITRAAPAMSSAAAIAGPHWPPWAKR